MRILSALRVGTFALSAVVLASSVGAASASPWTHNHPWREQVNSRLALQNARIHFARATGQISGFQARKLHREDRIVRHEERLMASMNGGHLTKGEHRMLNRQENRISHRI
ncbi:MAG TPA: hypothetical protein VG271_14390 [Beijerinckiaceae bacterium]|jgi:hypothetical protein|nr:hypothetical protein [Beijerinckiaceae bacterium]